MKDYRIETFRSSGNGGQNVNKLETAVRITHIPTGLVAQSQDQRHQHQNKAKAFERLHEKIANHERIEKLRQRNEVRAGLHKGRVRTYNLITNQVTDNIRGIKFNGAKQLLEGDLDMLDRT